MAQGKRRDPEREARWRAVLARQGESGLSVREFCRRERLPESALHAWRRIIQQRDAGHRRPGDATRPAFVALRLRPDDGRSNEGA